MSFFYSSPAGAADALALAFVAGVAFWWGQHRARTFALSLVAVFLLHRLLIATTGTMFMMTAGGLMDFIAAVMVLNAEPNRWGRSMAALFGLKIMTYIALMLNLVEWESMTALTTVWVYLQFLLTLAAVRHGPGIFRNRPADRNGHTTRLLPVARRFQDE